MNTEEEIDLNKIELNAEYTAKGKFDFRISHVPPNIIIHLKIHDINKKDEIIEMFGKFVEHIFEDNKKKGIKRVYLVDSKDVIEHMIKNKKSFENKKDFIIETQDLLTGEFVPLFAKFRELEE